MASGRGCNHPNALWGTETMQNGRIRTEDTSCNHPNALWGTETTRNVSLPLSAIYVATTPTPFGALKHRHNGGRLIVRFRCNHPNALWGTETLPKAQWQSRVRRCNHPNALWGTETVFGVVGRVGSHRCNHPNALWGTETPVATFSMTPK